MTILLIRFLGGLFDDQKHFEDMVLLDICMKLAIYISIKQQRRCYMRYRKRISLGKGASINISKSGVSFTSGIKGLSVNSGKKGTYVNYGIPGTGIYDRKKVGGGQKTGRNTRLHNNENQTGIPQPAIQSVRMNYNEDGAVAFFDEKGMEITDPGIIRWIKSTSEYQEGLNRLTNQRVNAYTRQMEQITNIQKRTPKVHSVENSIKMIQNKKPRKYVIRRFPEAEPTMDEVIDFLKEKAERTITALTMRKKIKLWTQFIDDNKFAEYQRRHYEWEQRRNAFLEVENSKKAHFDSEERRVLEEKRMLQRIMQGDESAIEESIDAWLATVQFSFDFNLAYEVAGNSLFVDLDLPEIEMLPENKVQVMANGTAKFKPKSQKEIKEDYSNCVFGLALFFAGNLFNKAVLSETIIISGYTQRRNTVGDIVDDYIYSIIFDRDTFSRLDLGQGTSFDNCMKFKNRVIQNRDLSFKPIVPYDEDNL